MSSDTAGRAEAVRDRYRKVFGHVPAAIDDRLSVAEATGRRGAVEAIDALRRALLAENPLEPRASLVTSGMPAYGLAVEIIAALDRATTQPDPTVMEGGQ